MPAACLALAPHPGETHATFDVFVVLRQLSSWDLVLVIALLVVGAAYVVALARIWARAGRGRGVRAWEAAAFGAGWGTSLASLVGLDALSEVLFAAHMTQHELLMLVAAPLIVVGRPLVVLTWIAPATARRRIRRAQTPALVRAWRAVTAPVTVLALHGIVVWIWHVPVLFEAALHSEAVHAFQHLGFFWTAALFWWSLVHGRYGRLGYGVAVVFVFATAMHTSLLGALLTFAPSTWYPTYARTVAARGGSALEDQQLAGLLMWVPSGVILLLLGLSLFAAWLGATARRAEVLARPTARGFR